MLVSAKVRYGIAGFGRHAVKRLMPGFAKAEHCIVTALSRRETERAAASAAEFRVPHSFGSTEEMCRSSEVDVVYIASPDAVHLTDVLTALRHGKHVLCEKPMGMNAAECRQMVRAAEQAQRILGVAHVFRLEESVLRARESVSSGELGESTQARAEFHYWNQGHGRAWINDPRLACGGPMADVGIHCIDALRFILQEEVTHVTTIAQGDDRSAPMESSAIATLEFSGGVLGEIAVSTRAHYRTTLEIVGSKGVFSAEDSFSVDTPVKLVVTATPSCERREQVVSNADAFTRQLDGFAQTVRGEAEWTCSGAEGVRNQLVLDAAYRSWKSGKRERVEKV